MGKIRIFEHVKDSLYAVGHHKNPTVSAYEEVVNKWQDTEYLEDFFERHEYELYTDYPGIAVEQAVRKTQMESAYFDEKVLRCAEKQQLGKFVFTPLHKNDRFQTYIQSKAYGTDTKSWLRLYAVRLAENVYVVTGGAIKLTASMSTPELKQELRNLKNATQTLINLGLLSAETNESGYLELRIEEQ